MQILSNVAFEQPLAYGQFIVRLVADVVFSHNAYNLWNTNKKIS